MTASAIDDRDRVAAEVAGLLRASAPQFDLQAVGRACLSARLCDPVEADDIAQRASLPAWLRERLAGLAPAPPAHATDEVTGQARTLLPGGPLAVPVPAVLPGGDDITAAFRAVTVRTAPVRRTDGGASVHDVSNFRKLAWTDAGLIEGLCDRGAEIYQPFLAEAEPVALGGRTLVAVAEGSALYVHWLIDALPRLLLLAEDEDGLDGFDQVLIAADAHPFHRATLARLGIGRDRVVSRGRRGSLFRLDRFTHVGAPRTGGVAAPGVYDRLSRFFAPMPPRHRGRRLYITRAGAARRRILNEDDLVAALIRQGFESIGLESLDIPATAALMAEASHVVAPHGAGLANLVFARPGTRVIEIFGAHMSRDYWLISAQRGLDYLAVEARDPSGRHWPPGQRARMTWTERNHADMIAPVAEIIAALGKT